MLPTKLLFAITLILLNTSGLSITTNQVGECCEEYCYDEDISKQQYKHFATKSAYNFTKGSDTQIYNIPGCNAEKIWMLVRHGTRLPSSLSTLLLKDLEQLRDEIVILYDDNIEDTNLTLPEKGRLSAADLDLIKNWKWDTNVTTDHDEYLTVSGWNEVKTLAEEYRNAFPELFGTAYSSEKFRFIHTNTQRTEASYKAFVEGLFGDGAYNNFTIDPPTNLNMILDSQDLCETYKENIIIQNGPNSEAAKFRRSEIYQKLRSDVSLKIGYFVPAFQPLSDIVISNIYDMCRFDKAWNLEKPSPWCSVLTQSQIKILEYHEDLDYYIKSSYGSDVNLKLACSAMNDMLGHLATDVSPKVVAYFGHIRNIHSHLTALGAFKDEISLRNDNFDTMDNRKWKNSDICPFTANLAVVKYHCPSEIGEKEKVKFFINQNPLRLDWCDSNGICNLSDVMEQYSMFRNGDCDEIFCSTSNRVSSQLLLISVLSLAMFIAFLK